MSTQATRQRERAFEAFAQGAKEALGDDIHEIILYGSTARGEATEHSDVDILVILTTTEEAETLYALAFDIGLEHGVVISPHIKTREKFESRKDFPFLRNVRREGRLYG
ncbi:nucleotidyltransferase domain-containing protein [Halocatena marina]|uniref:Nucleotidyltransferase domain-containing protein n=1 Tax=Halocatena marina TaxID=2934937 RepID=A0ABD5YM12_9EURY|nr:nucleotidyltransferase domain-containing protein [Halocatena marina]